MRRDGFRLTGHAALPTYSRGNAVQQYLYVNGRRADHQHHGRLALRNVRHARQRASPDMVRQRGGGDGRQGRVFRETTR